MSSHLLFGAKTTSSINSNYFAWKSILSREFFRISIRKKSKLCFFLSNLFQTTAMKRCRWWTTVLINNKWIFLSYQYWFVQNWDFFFIFEPNGLAHMRAHIEQTKKWCEVNNFWIEKKNSHRARDYKKRKKQFLVFFFRKKRKQYSFVQR